MIITIILTVIFVLNLFVDMVLPVLPVVLPVLPVRGGGEVVEGLSPLNFPLDESLPGLAQISLETQPLPGLVLRRQSWQRPPVVSRAQPGPVRLPAPGVDREGGRVLQGPAGAGGRPGRGPGGGPGGGGPEERRCGARRRLFCPQL